MEDLLASSIDSVIKNAERIGALSTNSILALVCLYLGWERWSDRQNAAKDAEQRSQLRIKEAEANILLGKALEKQADSIERIEVILDERLKRV